ncbi:MAG TPA: hypothetical protein VNL91_11305 [Thermoanaerobaculia bacterium]|nr:hypothetical protein [Thermoanaerobaculia bacterium]
MPSNTKPSSREESRSAPRTAAAYLREAGANDPHRVDCADHVCRIAALLDEEGKSPWVGMVRDRQGDFHGALIPRSFRGVTWTKHYVCCAGEEAWDPLAGSALSLADYTTVVFGRPLAVERYLSEDETADLLHRGALRDAFRPRRAGD